MTAKNIQRSGSLLCLFILGVMVWYGRLGNPLLPGALYLIVASWLGVSSLCFATTLQAKQRNSTPEPAAWAIHLRAYVLVITGWLVAIVGLLTIWQFGFSESRAAILLGYGLVGVFVILSYKLVAIADDPRQRGGSRPLNYFGRPRSRRLFVCGFVYTPLIPLSILSVTWSDAKWCPVLLRNPLFWLFLTALLSAFSTALICQRYRTVGGDKSLANKALIGTLLVLGTAGAIHVLVDENTYVYILTSTSLACIACSFYYLHLAREESLPSQSV